MVHSQGGHFVPIVFALMAHSYWWRICIHGPCGANVCLVAYVQQRPAILTSVLRAPPFPNLQPVECAIEGRFCISVRVFVVICIFYDTLTGIFSVLSTHEKTIWDCFIFSSWTFEILMRQWAAQNKNEMILKDDNKIIIIYIIICNAQCS